MTVGSVLEVLPRVSLEEMTEIAELHTRTDRKYIIDHETLGRMLDARAQEIAILDIEGRYEFNYESIYFDNADLDLYRAAAFGRRRRFKVRTRLYKDSGLTMLEVKFKDGRGRTVKERLSYDRDNRTRLTAGGQRFVDDIVGQPGLAATLQPVLTTQYRRMTVVDMASMTRATIDRGLLCTNSAGDSVTLDSVIIESKSDLSASPLDRWLWRHGSRPVRISKCCTAMAAMRPDLPSNKWHRTLNRHFR